MNRKILIVDDNKNVTDLDVPGYLAELKEIQEKCNTSIEFEFTVFNTIEESLIYLNSDNIVDVVLIDYNFNCKSGEFSNGVDLVLEIRNTINKQCRIIFYTMDSITNIHQEELKRLINSNIYKFIDKRKDAVTISETIYNAALECNFVALTLERFLFEYKTLLSKHNYSILGESVSVEEIIKNIRLDSEIGREMIENIIHRTIILNLDIQES